MDLPVLSTPPPVDLFPTNWLPAREPTNPVIAVNATETTEQYVPSPIQLDNGDIWVFVKGNTSIYAYKSTNGGVTFSIQNAGSPVLTPGAGGSWDSGFVLEPHAVYDKANATIHLYYFGYNGTVPGAGHATATVTASVPGSFTKDVGNPIVSASAVNTDLGGAGVGNALVITSVLKIGSTFHFYGYCIYGGAFRLLHWTGTTWNNPSSTRILLSAPTNWQSVVETPSVFSYGNLYGMFYTLGGSQPSYGRSLFVGASSDGANWEFDSSTIISPGGVGWESVETYSCQILRSNVSPFSSPVVDANGRWHLYYSGHDGTHGQSGLAYLTPS